MADTPPPRPLVGRDDEPSQSIHLGHECPYRDEVHLVRRLREAGVEEQVFIGRRRDRVGVALAIAGLAAALTLGSSAIIGGMTLARDVGRAEAGVEARLQQLERDSQGTSSSLVQLGRLEARLEALDQRFGERLDDISERIGRLEGTPRRQGRR